jgi:hypothetical protein
MAQDTNTPAAIRLEVRGRIEGDWVYVSYQLENRGEVAWLAYDAAASQTAAPAVLSRLCPVSFAPPATLRILQIRPSPPAGVDVAFVVVPYVRRLEPGARLDGSFRVKHPVVEHNHFTPDYPGASYEDGDAKEIELSIGGFAPRENTQLVPVPGIPGGFQVRDGFGAQDIVKATAPLSVPVRIRTDAAFDRR